MKVLVIFESLEGQTKKIAQFVADRIRASGLEVRMFDAADRKASLTLEGFERVIMAAPVHERRHPRDFEVVLSSNEAKLKRVPTMMLSVSLNAAFSAGLDDARDYLIELKMRTGVDFDRELLVAGAVRTESYGYFENHVVHNVVLDGRRVDLIDGVREFTDFEHLGSEIDAFVNKVADAVA